MNRTPWIAPAVASSSATESAPAPTSTTVRKHSPEQHAIAAEAKEANISFVLYDLRHTFGTRQATEEKTDPFTLAKIMGHANLRTIMRYVHPDDGAQREAMRRYAEAIQRKKICRVK